MTWETRKMKRFYDTLLLILGAILIFSNAMAGGPKKYIVMRQDLSEIKNDFNESADKVRLLFIISPT